MMQSAKVRFCQDRIHLRATELQLLINLSRLGSAGSLQASVEARNGLRAGTEGRSSGVEGGGLGGRAVKQARDGRRGPIVSRVAPESRS